MNITQRKIGYSFFHTGNLPKPLKFTSQHRKKNLIKSWGCNFLAFGNFESGDTPVMELGYSSRLHYIGHGIFVVFMPKNTGEN